MGIGGALMWPAILGMTFAILPADKAGLAGGIILGAAGLGNAVGPLIGGVLRHPELALDVLPQRADLDLRRRRHLALDQVAYWGWSDPRVIALLTLTAILVAAFIPIERRPGAHALVPREIMRNRSFSASCVAILFMSATFFASLLYLPQLMEKQFGYSPLQAGIGILPFLGVFAVVSFVAVFSRVDAAST